MNYTIITHLENSENEIKPLLERIGLANLKIGDQYNWINDTRIKSEIKRPPEELHWRNVPRETAKLIYKHFFLDFIVFGYTTDDVLRYSLALFQIKFDFRYINASDSKKKRPTQEIIDLSRQNLATLKINYFKKYTDHVCK